MSDVTIESLTVDEAGMEAARALGPEGERGIDTGSRPEVPLDGTAEVVSAQAIINSQDPDAPTLATEEETPPAEGEPPVEPEVPPTPAEVEAAVAAAAAGEPPVEPKVPKKKQTGAERAAQIQGQIKDLTTQKYTETAAVEALRAEKLQLEADIAARKGGTPPPPTPETPAAETPPPVEATPPAETPPVTEDVRPESGDFKTYEDYIEALTDWKAEKAARGAEARVEARLKKQETDAAKEAQAAAGREAANAAMAAHKERLDAAKVANPEFDAIIAANADIRLTGPMEHTILHSEVGPELMIHLCENRVDYQRLRNMVPGDALRELGKLEARYEGEKVPTGTPLTPTPVTRARAPIKPVGATPTENTADPAKMSYQDFKKLRNAQLKGSGRR